MNGAIGRRFKLLEELCHLVYLELYKATLYWSRLGWSYWEMDGALGRIVSCKQVEIS